MRVLRRDGDGPRRRGSARDHVSKLWRSPPSYRGRETLLDRREPSLCLTPASPERLRLEFGVTNVQLVQVSSRASGATDPRNLDPAGLKFILPMTREGKGGVVLYDAVDQMIAESSIGDMIRFLR